MAPIILGYWDLRGRAQPIRNLLEYVGEDYEEKKYAFQEREKWLKDKAQSPLLVGGAGEEGLEFPNLPFYIETREDGSKLKLTQSLVILKHIGRKHGLVVDKPDDVLRMESYEQEAADLGQALLGYAFNFELTKLRFPNYAEDIKSILAKWEQALQNKTWLMGDKLTYVDFLLFEFLDWHLLLSKTILNTFPNLKAYAERFRSMPKLAAYFASDRYQDWPVLSPMAVNFGWKKPE